MSDILVATSVSGNVTLLIFIEQSRDRCDIMHCVCGMSTLMRQPLFSIDYVSFGEMKNILVDLKLLPSVGL